MNSMIGEQSTYKSEMSYKKYENRNSKSTFKYAIDILIWKEHIELAGEPAIVCLFPKYHNMA